jgi:Protein of unknown function (DUF732)
MMKKLLIPAVACAAVFLATPAHADEQGFNNYMASHGYPSLGPSGTGFTYLSQAQQECSAMRGGKPQEWLIGQLESQLSSAEAGLVVTGAHQYLCPDA